MLVEKCDSTQLWTSTSGLEAKRLRRGCWTVNAKRWYPEQTAEKSQESEREWHLATAVVLELRDGWNAKRVRYAAGVTKKRFGEEDG